VGDSWEQEKDTDMAACGVKGCYQCLHDGLANVNGWATLCLLRTWASPKTGCLI